MSDLQGMADLFLRPDWGTLAQWVSGLLTSVTVIIGLGVFRRDRLREKRKYADSLVVWLSTSSPREVVEYGGTLYFREIHVHNTAELEVPLATLRTKVKRGAEISDQLLTDYNPGLGRQVTTSIPAKTSFRHETAFSSFTDKTGMLLFIRDARGQEWYRDLDKGKYVAQRVWDAQAKRQKRNLDSHNARGGPVKVV